MPRVTPAAFAAAGLLTIALGACAGPGASGPPMGTASAAASGPGIVAEVASYELVARRPGRLLVALLAADNRWLSFGSVDMRFTFMGDRTHSAPPGVGLDPAAAPFLPIPGTPEGDGRQPTLTNPADGRGVYAIEPITFPAAGFWQVTASGALEDGGTFSADAAFEVLETATVVGIGDEAPRSDNAVIGDAGVASVSIDSRASDGEPIPDPELHATSIADAIAAGHPALVVFSTPVYCVSRFCGPVTDMVADLAADYADRADFIHVEIYRDFESGAINPAVTEWLQGPSGDIREPWTFLIGADGRILGSWDTLVSRAEIEPLLRALPPL
jgi:hypothetical protein